MSSQKRKAFDGQNRQAAEIILSQSQRYGEGSAVVVWARMVMDNRRADPRNSWQSQGELELKS